MSYVGNPNTNQVEIRTTRFRYTATEGQTVFSGGDTNGLSLTGIDSSSAMFLNGAKLSIDGDYAINKVTPSITLTSGAFLNDILEVVELTQVTIADVGGAVKRSGDTMSGNLVAPTMALSRTEMPAQTGVMKRSDAPFLGTNSVIRTNAQNIAENITIDSATNAMSSGPLTIDSGFTITLNGNWAIV